MGKVRNMSFRRSWDPAAFRAMQWGKSPNSMSHFNGIQDVPMILDQVCNALANSLE